MTGTTFVTVMPWVHEPYMRDCLATCKFADDVLTIDNSAVNLGVSRSWNMGIDKMHSEKADWLIVMSSAVRFGSRGGLDFVTQLALHPGYLVVEAVDTLLGWHLVAFSRECVHRVGRFDENLFPGYYGDLDYSLRFQRYYGEDFRRAPPPTKHWKQVVVDATDMGMAHGLKHGNIEASAEPMIDYFTQKWGRHPDKACDDAYLHPFNDDNNPIGYWPSTMVNDIPGRWDCPAIPDFIPQDTARWKRTVINASRDTSYEFDLPWPLYDWENLVDWEHERFESMRTHLQQGDVLYDVGAEQGWCSLIYAKFVGAENMVLIEPSTVQWPNIKSTWERNYDRPPLACFNGFVSDETSNPAHGFTWPNSCDGPLITRIAYKHLFEHLDVPKMTLDDLCDSIGRAPDAINIDVEGAELSVLKGMLRTIGAQRPKIWMSIHPDLMKKWYNTQPQQIHNLMFELNYDSEFLSYDHEEHWMFTPR